MTHRHTGLSEMRESLSRNTTPISSEWGTLLMANSTLGASNSSGFVGPGASSFIRMPKPADLVTVKVDPSTLKGDKDKANSFINDVCIPAISYMAAIIGISIEINPKNEEKQVSREIKPSSATMYKSKGLEQKRLQRESLSIWDKYLFDPPPAEISLSRIDVQKLFSDVNKLKEDEFAEIIRTIETLDPKMAAALRENRS